ncbi:unnamed protein product, partial [Schistocephalus solidus]|uniref:CST complex subunit CTC1 n=1 Tax=Schistocephalus solidus TaxID=70667 RepID=A0A183S8P3_SCHSO
QVHLNEHLALSSVLILFGDLSQPIICCSSLSIILLSTISRFLVIIGRPDKQHARPFYGLRATALNLKWPFSGTIIPLTVQHSLKGNLQTGQRLEVYYAEGAMCGVTEDMLPTREGSYLISGQSPVLFDSLPISTTCFKPSVSLGSRCHLPPEIYLVTRCGWTAPLQDLTITQMAGLFLGMYSCDEGTCQFVPSASGDAAAVGKHNFCRYIYSATPCFSRYSLCVSVGQNGTKAGTCRLRAVKKIPSVSKSLQLIPRELHGKIFQAETLRITDEDRFSACLAHRRV